MRPLRNSIIHARSQSFYPVTHPAEGLSGYHSLAGNNPPTSLPNLQENQLLIPAAAEQGKPPYFQGETLSFPTALVRGETPLDSIGNLSVTAPLVVSPYVSRTDLSCTTYLAKRSISLRGPCPQSPSSYRVLEYLHASSLTFR